MREVLEWMERAVSSGVDRNAGIVIVRQAKQQRRERLPWFDTSEHAFDIVFHYGTLPSTRERDQNGDDETSCSWRHKAALLKKIILNHEINEPHEKELELQSNGCMKASYSRVFRVFRG